MKSEQVVRQLVGDEVHETDLAVNLETQTVFDLTAREARPLEQRRQRNSSRLGPLVCEPRQEPRGVWKVSRGFDASSTDDLPFVSFGSDLSPSRYGAG